MFCQIASDFLSTGGIGVSIVEKVSGYIDTAFLHTVKEIEAGNAFFSSI